MKPTERIPQVGEVWLEEPDTKFVVCARDIAKMSGHIEEFEFVCDKPHADGDFSYLCWREWCKCQE